MLNEGKVEELKRALQGALADQSSDSEKIIEKVMTTLDRSRLLRYHNQGDISLLSTPGRVIIALLEDNTMTQRALSVYLDLSETMIDKTIKTLINKGLITKTKLNRQNVYKVNEEELHKHPDIRHFAEAISYMLKRIQEKDKERKDVGDSAPF